jgi:hypothetical protein
MSTDDCNSWSAIVRGAAAKGLEGDGRAPIKNRKARRNYGTGCYRDFVAGQHTEGDSFICAFTGIKSAKNQTRWLIIKGQNLSTSEGAHTKVPFHQYFWIGDNKSANLDLLAHDADTPASRTKDKVNFPAVQYINMC